LYSYLSVQPDQSRIAAPDRASPKGPDSSSTRVRGLREIAEDGDGGLISGGPQLVDGRAGLGVVASGLVAASGDVVATDLGAESTHRAAGLRPDAEGVEMIEAQGVLMRDGIDLVVGYGVVLAGPRNSSGARSRGVSSAAALPYTSRSFVASESRVT
jgi:hypothetical protein